MMRLPVTIFLLLPLLGSAFVSLQPGRSLSLGAGRLAATFEASIDLPGKSGLRANLAFEPVLSVPSEIITVRYKVPFGYVKLAFIT
jgi:hypothetical protein